MDASSHFDIAQKSLERAVAALGSRSEFARQLGISRAAVAQWNVVPVRRVIDVERVTGVSRYELRPDIYPPPSIEGFEEKNNGAAA